MTPSVWVAIAGVALAGLAQLAGLLVWGAKTSEKVRHLEAKAKEHGDIRDLVIEMRTEMRGFRESLQGLAEALKQPANRRRAGE